MKDLYINEIYFKISVNRVGAQVNKGGVKITGQRQYG